ncbi:hypothetical protein Q5P01_017882 [Channa striata]|uniref:Uncharacterized protein n=1 Tax=Channa striata TaxID=64152 RepID=A0AA88M3N9_CHASR|nr:hypothetical protein Q5P01_017882 [Channa striata]
MEAWARWNPEGDRGDGIGREGNGKGMSLGAEPAGVPLCPQCGHGPDVAVRRANERGREESEVRRGREESEVGADYAPSDMSVTEILAYLDEHRVGSIVDFGRAERVTRMSTDTMASIAAFRLSNTRLSICIDDLVNQ